MRALSANLRANSASAILLTAIAEVSVRLSAHRQSRGARPMKIRSNVGTLLAAGLAHEAPDDVARMLDYTQRVSSNEAHASPTRGRQGNAIQTVLAMPFVLDGKHSETIIESRGVKHTIEFEVDPIRLTPKLSTTQAKGGFVQFGTAITVNFASEVLRQARTRIDQIVDHYSVLNPHLTISLRFDGKQVTNATTGNPAWFTWVSGDLSSAHWYDLARFNRLIQATIASDQDNGRDTLVREFIAANFRGMARSDVQKQVMDRTRI
jgi:hypothetical protein